MASAGPDLESMVVAEGLRILGLGVQGFGFRGLQGLRV